MFTIAENYAEYLSAHNNEYKQRTIDTYYKRVRTLIYWLNGEQITAEKCRKFLKEKKSTSSTNYNLYYYALREFNRFLTETRNFPDFISDFDTKKRRRKKRIDILSTQEISDLLSVKLNYSSSGGYTGGQLDEMYRSAIKFIVFTGCRIGEALSLRVRDCDFSTGRVWLIDTKNDTDRLCLIKEPFLGHLKSLCTDKNDDDHVFTNSCDRPISAKRLRPDLKRRAKKAGITKNVYPHLLRHSFAMALKGEGVSIEDIAKLLGHNDIRTTYENYMHLGDEHIKKALARLPILKDVQSGKEQLMNIVNYIESIEAQKYDKIEYEVSKNGKFVFFKAEIKPEYVN